MTNRTRAKRLFDAERGLKAARRKVKSLETRCERLADELERVPAVDGQVTMKLHEQKNQEKIT